MMRAAVGSWVMILVFSALVVSSGLWGAAEPGVAVRQAPPAAPAIGTCTLGLRAPQIVPCDSPHDGEIVLTWTGGVPSTTLDPTRFPPESFPADTPQPHCQQAAEDYFGLAGRVEFSPDIGWYPIVGQWQTAIGDGPTPRFIEGWSWSACLIRGYGNDGNPIELTQSLRGAGRTPSPALPESWRTCLPNSGYWTEWKPCGDAHRAELVASAEIALTEEADRRRLSEQIAEMSSSPSAQLGVEIAPTARTPTFDLDLPAAEQECRDLVENYLGTSLDDRDDLRAVMSYESPYYGDSVTVDPAVDVPVGVYGSCSIEVLGDRELVGSVAGVGTGPLPYG